MGKKLLLVIPVLLLLGSLYVFRDTILVRKPVVEQSEATVLPVEREDGVEWGNPKPVKVYELEYYVNVEREKAGVKPLVSDSRLNESARLKAESLYEEDRGLQHVDENGKRGYEYIADVGIYCATSSENAAFTGYGSKNVVYGFMTSDEGHREALLNPEYDLVGYAVKGKYVVQHFCNID